jgi:hypothetical protein
LEAIPKKDPITPTPKASRKDDRTKVNSSRGRYFLVPSRIYQTCERYLSITKADADVDGYDWLLAT